MGGRLLDRGEAAERLHVSEMTIRRLGRAGRPGGTNEAESGSCGGS
jgi:hypothetical protein